MTGIAGSPPDLRQLPSGCVFHPRCPYVMDKCRTKEPKFTAMGAESADLPAGGFQKVGPANGDDGMAGFVTSGASAGHAAARWLQNAAQPPPPPLARRAPSVLRCR